MKMKMYQVPVTEMFAVRAQVIICESANMISSYPGKPNDDTPEVPMD